MHIVEWSILSNEPHRIRLNHPTLWQLFEELKNEPPTQGRSPSLRGGGWGAMAPYGENATKCVRQFEFDSVVFDIMVFDKFYSTFSTRPGNKLLDSTRFVLKFC